VALKTGLGFGENHWKCHHVIYHIKMLLGSQNFEIRSRDLGHAHFGVVWWSGRSRGPWSMSVPNLKRIYLLV